MKAILIKALAQNQIALPESAINRLLLYLELLTKWNQVFNLTNITNPHDMVYLHIIDSLVILPLLHGKQCLDVGTGAGLPGIPLAIANPEKNWVLIDKNSKKVRFLTQAIAELELQNVTAIHADCRNFHPDYCFDTILSRAFSALNDFVTMTVNLLCEGGLFIAMKGKYPKQEIAELNNQFMIKEAKRLTITGVAIERHAVILTRRDEQWEK